MTAISRSVGQLDAPRRRVELVPSERSASRRRQARTKDKVTLIHEAIALEVAGCTWTQAHVAALCNKSASYIRNSDCPKSYEEGHGPKGKPMLVYEPPKVRPWMATRIRATVDPARRR